MEKLAAEAVNRLAQVYHSQKEYELYDVEQMIWHITNTHTIEDKRIILFSIHKDKREQKYSYAFDLGKLQDQRLLSQLLYISKDYDLYMSQNTFFSHRRTKDSAWASECMIIDLDYYKMDHLKDLKPEQIVGLLHEENALDGIEPNYYIASGRGVNLVYLLNRVPLYKYPKNRRLWELVVKAIVDRLSDYGADAIATDISRVNRLPCTINHTSGNKEVVEILNYEDSKTEKIERYTLSYLADELLQEIPQREKKKKTRKAAAVHRFFTPYSLHIARAEDIERLVQLREGEMNHYREFSLFIYALCRMYHVGDLSVMRAMTFDLNESFTDPLREREVSHAVQMAYENYGLYIKKRLEKGKSKEMNDGIYEYKNSTLIRNLDITQEEMQHMKVLIDRAEKNNRKKEKRRVQRRNENGLTPKQQEKKERLEKVEELLDKGKKQKEIAEMLEISKATVERAVREYKKNSTRK